MTLEMENSRIRSKVFRFYAKHWRECDKLYSFAQDKRIEDIYDDVTDPVKQNSLFAMTSIVLLTANKYEKNILHRKIFEIDGNKIQRIEIKLSTACERFNSIYSYFFHWNDYNVLHIHANVTGSYTIGGSADVAKWVLSNKYLLPTAMFSFGVCFGTDDTRYELGDVIISKKIYPYFIGAKINGENLCVVDDNAFRLDDNLYNRIKRIMENNRFNDLGFKVELDNYITGEAVVSSLEERDKFVNTTTQRILAGEMEGYGLFKECKSKEANLPCVVLKSICDWGAEKNFEYNDATVMTSFLSILEESGYALSTNQQRAKKIIKSLKDRFQAYSAACAFSVLDILLRNKLFAPSIFNSLKKNIESYNGVATTCNGVRRKVHEHIRELDLNYSPSMVYIHRCLMILENEGLVKCDVDCVSCQNKNDDCINIERDASIDIEKEMRG